jgi:hypothetical protein
MSAKPKVKRPSKGKKPARRKPKAKSTRKRKTRPKVRPRGREAKHAPSSRRKPASTRRKPTKTRRRPVRDLLLEHAVRDMNRGGSLTAAAKSIGTPPKKLKAYLRQHHISRRKGKSIATRDNRLRRVSVMTNGKIRVVIVRGYEAARLVGAHHNAAGQFVRTNDTRLIEPFEGESVQAATGRNYVLETDPNELHRIAAMDTPPFHEIYEITSNS